MILIVMVLVLYVLLSSWIDEVEILIMYLVLSHKPILLCKLGCYGSDLEDYAIEGDI